MSDCSVNAWKVPAEREPGVLYDHGQPNYDYLQARAIVVGGVRFERVRTCQNISRDGFKCSDCGGTWFNGHNFGRIAFRRCPDCGAEVVDA